ncbi:MAG: hypothetical protein LUG92_06565, partial [Oscillospiraceae bacterium]|nr:hypothetical protein [Oscillospiraceae bacterium]
MPDGATFYYQYVITEDDYDAGARFDESYLKSVQTKIENGSYVANTIVGIELSEDERTMTIYMGSAAGTEVDSVLQPYEQDQPAMDTSSSLTELEGWNGTDLDGKSQTLSSSYYISSALKTYYGQNNTTFTSSLKKNYGFTYTLTLGEGQSIDDAWYDSVRADIVGGNETGVVAIEKSPDSKTYTMYFDAYNFYKTTRSLPSVTLTDTSTQVFGDAWTDGTYTLSTTDSLATHLAYTDSGNTASIYAKDLTLSPSLVTKTYDIYIDTGSYGTVDDTTSGVKPKDSDAAGYTVSTTEDGKLLISGVRADGADDFYISIGAISINSGKMLYGFEVNTTSSTTGVSCGINKESETYSGTTWTFTNFASTDTEASHIIYVNAVYADTADMYISLSDGVTVCEDAELYANNSDITNVNRQNSGYIIITAR